MAEEITFEEYEAATKRPVTVTPQEVANRLHQMTYGAGTEHLSVHSCPCKHLALFYLGVTESPGLYWPDGKGANAWDKSAAAASHVEG